MNIKDFLTEQWMNDYERQARFNMTDTSALPMGMEELLAFEPDLFNGLVLDYGWITGDPALRREILSLYEDQREETLTMTNGTLQANELVMNILLKAGDHVVTITPGYQQFSDYPRWLGCTVSELPLIEDGWTLDWMALEEEFQKGTRLMVFASPNNPTGTWLNREEVLRLRDLVRKYDVWILCDEVYRQYDADECAMSDVYEKGVSTASLSKLFGLAGVRLGWVKACPELIAQINVFRDYTLICAGPLSEKAAWAGLHHRQEILERSKKKIAENKKILAKWLEKSPWFSCQLPRKGTVSFLKLPEGLSSREFAKGLLEETGIFFVPGWCFGMDQYVRLSLGRNFEDLEGVLDRIDVWTAKKMQEKKEKLSTSGQ